MPGLIPIAELPCHPRLAAGTLVVVALCAEWCGTCREFRPMLERIAAAHPDALFAWADVEDDADLVGDIDVDNFPTLAIFRDGKPLHFGVSLPLEPVVSRLLQSVVRGGGAQQQVPVEVAELGGRLAG
ncbi:thioredoxin family protein [Thauera sinica]|uniref:Thioredoxin family protein n=1 Tax=Thauera sinica TaxID=2665146 RepID=A0ABW1AKU4_9RHOO|nr:thioredoxin family protein [Thauera sp. K11]ATE59855.1 thiol reductase thioredoxin [Thauera sp. K11]